MFNSSLAPSSSSLYSCLFFPPFPLHSLVFFLYSLPHLLHSSLLTLVLLSCSHCTRLRTTQSQFVHQWTGWELFSSWECLPGWRRSIWPCSLSRGSFLSLFLVTCMPLCATLYQSARQSVGSGFSRFRVFAQWRRSIELVLYPLSVHPFCSQAPNPRR